MASASVLQAVEVGGVDPAFVAMVVLRAVLVVVVVGLIVRGYARRRRERGRLRSESRRWLRGKGAEPEAPEEAVGATEEPGEPPDGSVTPTPEGETTRGDDRDDS